MVAEYFLHVEHQYVSYGFQVTCDEQEKEERRIT